MLIIMIGISGVLVGIGFVMPAVAPWRHEGSMTGLSIALLLLGFVLTLGGGGAAVRSIAKRA
jgi:hypothetical protein